MLLHSALTGIRRCRAAGPLQRRVSWWPRDRLNSWRFALPGLPRARDPPPCMRGAVARLHGKLVVVEWPTGAEQPVQVKSSRALRCHFCRFAQHCDSVARATSQAVVAVLRRCIAHSVEERCCQPGAETNNGFGGGLASERRGFVWQAPEIAQDGSRKAGCWINCGSFRVY